MPLQASEQTIKVFHDNISNIMTLHAKDLIRREDLGSELNFGDAEDDFEIAINLFKGLNDIDIMRVPESKIVELNNIMSNFLSYIKQIKAFSTISGPNNRQDLINNIINNYSTWFNIISPVVAYCTKAGTDYDALRRQAQEALNNFKDLQEQAKSNRDEAQKNIDEVLESVRVAANSVGVTQHTINFSEAAKEFNEQKTFWMKWIIRIGLLIIVYSFLVFWCSPITLAEPYIYHFLQSALPRFTGLIVLFYGLVICTRNYQAQAHNYIINKNKQNALSTFETFVNAASNDEIKNAVLMQTTKAIFSNPASGYLKNETSDDASSQIIEIVKDMSKVIK